MNSKKTKEDINERKKKRRIWIIVAAIALVIIILLLLLRCCCQSTTDYDTTNPTPDEVQSGMIRDGGKADLQGAETEYFNLRINTTPTLDNGKLNIRIENPAKNKAACQVDISVKLKDSTKVIYRSGRIEPNQSLEYCTIDAKLPAGRYSAVAHYVLYNKQDIVGQYNIELDLNVN